MKVRRERNEEFASPERRKAHFDKHVTGRRTDEFQPGTYLSSFAYESAADKLAATPVKTSDVNSKDNIVGFVEFKDNEECYVKYNKNDRALVVYVPSKSRAPKTGNLIKTYYKAHKDKYNELFDNFYLREIND